MAQNMNADEKKFRDTGSTLLLLTFLYIPVVGAIGFVGFLLGSDWPFGLSAIAWMAAIIVLSVKRFAAYFRWKGGLRK